MYLTDLSFIEEGTPNITEESLVNFSKMRMVRSAHIHTYLYMHTHTHIHIQYTYVMLQDQMYIMLRFDVSRYRPVKIAWEKLI